MPICRFTNNVVYTHMYVYFVIHNVFMSYVVSFTFYSDSFHCVISIWFVEPKHAASDDISKQLCLTAICHVTFVKFHSLAPPLTRKCKKMYVQPPFILHLVPTKKFRENQFPCSKAKMGKHTRDLKCILFNF
jgi:hypothetical protein